MQLTILTLIQPEIYIRIALIVIVQKCTGGSYKVKYAKKIIVNIRFCFLFV